VSELKAVMSMAEFRRWAAYYRAYPFDDLHRYHRPAALVASSVRRTSDIQPLIDWLQPDPAMSGFSSVDASVMRAFGVRPPGS
jgi:hypothetical protein